MAVSILFVNMYNVGNCQATNTTITAVKYIDPSNADKYQTNGFLILEGDEHNIIVYGENIDLMTPS